MRPLLIFIKGDMLILLPLLIANATAGIWDRQLMIILFLCVGLIRALGEMFYWLLQQFGPRKYRPYDFGLKNLDNNAIYILYQLFAFAQAVIFGGLLIWYSFIFI